MADLPSLFRELHRLLRFIQDLEENLSRLPRRRKAFQAKLASAEQALKDEQETLKRLKVTASEKDKTLRAKGEQIARSELRFNEVTSKKEADALKLEITHNREVSGKLEEEIFAALTEIDERTARIPELEKAIVQVRDEVSKFEADTAPKETAWKNELAQARADLKQTEGQIPPDHRPQYDRTVSSMGADGLALVRNRVCTACNTSIIRNVDSQLLGGQLVVCRCGRILYPEQVKPKEEDE